jgi:PAS domain S-box-containing protein
MNSSQIKRVGRFAVPVFTVGIFVIDWMTPLGVADWVLYFIPLLVSFYCGGRFSPLLLAAIFSVLTVMGFYLSPPGMESRIALINVLLGLGTLWAVAMLLSRLRQSMDQTRRMSAVVEQSPVSVIITDIQGRIEYVNPKFCALTGYSFEEVRGKNPRFLKSGEMPAETYQQLWATITTGQEWRGEFHNRKKNGATLRTSLQSKRTSPNANRSRRRCWNPSGFCNLPLMPFPPTSQFWTARGQSSQSTPPGASLPGRMLSWAAITASAPIIWRSANRPLGNALPRLPPSPKEFAPSWPGSAVNFCWNIPATVRKSNAGFWCVSLDLPK